MEKSLRWLDLLVLAAYVLLSLAFCYPLPAHLTTDVAGRYVDTRVFQWNNWWVKHAILNGLDLDFSRLIYYPPGASLVSHNINWVSSFLALPLDLLFGPTVAYNLTFLLTFFLSGFAMYLLVRDLTGHRGAAFVAGLVFAFSPYHVSGNLDGQMNLANVQWIPLCVLFVLRVVADRRWQDALWAGLFAALASLDCWFFAVFLALWGAVYVLYLAIAQRRSLSWRTVRLLGLAACVALVLLLPLLVPLLGELWGGEVASALDYYADDKAVDLLAFFTPSSDHPLTGGRDAPLYARFRHWRPAYLGLLPLLLALYAALMPRREAVLWWVSGLFFALLALGTTLHVGGVSYPAVPMPLALLLRVLPALKVIRQASRFNVMVSLSLAVLVGLACADLAGRLRGLGQGSARRWLAPALLALIGCLVSFEYLAWPCPLSTTRVSPFYERLAQEEGDLALLELPLDDFHSREYLYPQTIHHKPLVNGYVARQPPESQAYIDSHPLLNKLQSQIEIDPALHDVPAEMADLAANGVRYVVVHKLPVPPQPPVDEAVLDSWHALFGPEVAYADDEISVYKLPPAEPAQVDPLTESLGVAGMRARRAALPGQEVLAVDVTWVALDDPTQDYAGRLSLSGPSGIAAEGAAEVISPRYSTGQWHAGVVIREGYVLPIDPALGEGTYELTVTLVDPGTGADVGAVTYDVDVSAEPSPLVPALTEMQFPEPVAFGDEMRLLGYTPHEESGVLALDLYWQALRAMDTDYKVFVHLVRPSDGAIVAQVDTMPRHWSYPTSRWGRREVYVDRVEMDTSGVAAGTYALAVGAYEPGGDLLPASGADGQPVPDGRYYLEDALQVGGR